LAKLTCRQIAEYYQSLLQESSRPDETVQQEIERDLGRTLPGADGPHGEGDYFSSVSPRPECNFLHT